MSKDQYTATLETVLKESVSKYVNVITPKFQESAFISIEVIKKFKISLEKRERMTNLGF